MPVPVEVYDRVELFDPATGHPPFRGVVTMRSLGLTKVRGALGGTYYE